MGLNDGAVGAARQHAARRSDTRLCSNLPVLDPDRLFPAVVTPIPTRDVSCRHDAVGGEETVVTHDAVLDGETRAGQPVRRGDHADANDDDVCPHHFTAAELHDQPAPATDHFGIIVSRSLG